MRMGGVAETATCCARIKYSLIQSENDSVNKIAGHAYLHDLQLVCYVALILCGTAMGIWRTVMPYTERKCASTAANGRSIMWRTTIRQSSMPTLSHRCRKNWQDEPRNARSSMSARQQSEENTAESMHSHNCLSAENAECHTADAHGQQADKRKLCGVASTVLTTAKVLPQLTSTTSFY